MRKTTINRDLSRIAGVRTPILGNSLRGAVRSRTSRGTECTSPPHGLPQAGAFCLGQERSRGDGKVYNGKRGERWPLTQPGRPDRYFDASVSDFIYCRRFWESRLGLFVFFSVSRIRCVHCGMQVLTVQWSLEIVKVTAWLMLAGCSYYDYCRLFIINIQGVSCVECTSG